LAAGHGGATAAARVNASLTSARLFGHARDNFAGEALIVTVKK
jgi:hypothetical protein